VNYQYWVIRFVPDPARGEFTNIGLVCGKDGADWAVAFDTRHLRNHGGFSPDLRELSAWRTNFEGMFDCGVESAVSSHWIEHLRARQANLVQFAEPMPIGVDSASDGVSLLMPRLVTR